MEILNKEVVEKKVLSKAISDKEAFWNEKLAFDFVFLLFQKSQSES